MFWFQNKLPIHLVTRASWETDSVLFFRFSVANSSQLPAIGLECWEKAATVHRYATISSQSISICAWIREIT